MMCETGDVWSGVKWTQEHTAPWFPWVVQGDGQPVTELSELWSIAQAQFVGTQAAQAVGWDWLLPLEQRDMHVWAPISKWESLRALGLTLNSSALGQDHIMWWHLKLLACEEVFVDFMVCLFNVIMDSGSFPSQFIL